MRSSSSGDAQRLDRSTADSSISTLRQQVLSMLPLSVQHVIMAVLARSQDPEPEVLQAHCQKAVAPQSVAWGWLPLLTLTSSLGMLSVAYAYNTARQGAEEDSFFWLGLLLIFVPSVVRLISPAASRFERLVLLCLIGICFYLVKVMFSPLYFPYYDEYLHWRTVNDITSSHHLFSQNALLPASPFYPGLEIVTNASSLLSGLSTLHAGIVVVGVARLIMILALFMLNEQITRSARVAGIATILYMANPQFLFFDAQFGYESLALPLATVMLFALASHESLNSDRRWITLAAWIVLGAISVTHHVTDFIFDGFILLWTLIYALQRSTALRQSNLVQTALFGILMSLTWINFPGNPVVQYLSSAFIAAVNELGHVLTGTNGGRHLFVDYLGQANPLWERIMSLSSVALISLCLPLGLLCLWQRYRDNALACMFGIVSLSYPISQIFRLTNSGSVVSERAPAFLFIPITCVLAIFITQFWPTRQLHWKQRLLITCAISVVFLGGSVLGSGPLWQHLPGPYLVAADTRSLEPQGIQAALWTRSYLGPDNRIATDRINQLLMGTYGNQSIVTSGEDGIAVSDIFLSPSFDSYVVSLIQHAQLHYLVVDLRLAKALPAVGFYFEEGESGSFQRTTPVDLEALTKFNTIQQINRVFDSGDIVIYDVGGPINAPKKP